MSKLGKRPIKIPEKVSITKQGNKLLFKGPLGEIEKKIDDVIEVEINDGILLLKRKDDSKRNKELHGLARAFVMQGIDGVEKGFIKILELVGIGYRALVQGKVLRLEIGYSNPIELEIPEGLEVVGTSATRIEIKGVDKELVGDFADKIRRCRPPEPYKGKGIKYHDERIRKKVGKAAGAVGAK